jgi:hypothetical protein
MVTGGTYERARAFVSKCSEPARDSVDVYVRIVRLTTHGCFWGDELDSLGLSFNSLRLQDLSPERYLVNYLVNYPSSMLIQRSSGFPPLLCSRLHHPYSVSSIRDSLN